MPSNIFIVEKYGVAQVRIAAEPIAPPAAWPIIGPGPSLGPSVGPIATLTLQGRMLGDDVVYAQLHFSPSFTGLVGQYRGFEEILVHLPYDDFAEMYDLLRHEAPVYVSYDYTEESTDLESFALLSYNLEPPGEGPADADSIESRIRSWSDRLPPSA